MDNFKRTLLLSIALPVMILSVFPVTVLAHVRWGLDSVTPPRTNDTGLKSSPCGGAARTTRSTIFSAGQTIDLVFEETINHPGHYRIAFSPADDLNFDSYVLVDNIPDVTNNGTYTQQVTIPMQTCTACTLQLIQVMTTSPTPTPSDYYYSCSDIQVTAPGDTTAPSPASGAMSQPGNSQVSVNWNNPASDFYQVVVLKDISPVVDSPVNGTIYANGDMINGSEVVYVGNGNAFTATALTNDLPYYFKIFAQNPRKNYAAGIETTATPTVTSSGGGAIHILFWSMLLMIRLIAKQKLLAGTKT